MADLNSGKGKFWGVDENVKYADSFKGATKVAEKVKKGGTENKSDGYVVDAIDIDWGGLKLTTIDNGWSQKTVSSTEQNAGKGENTQGIHSTAYLLNLISSSFDQIYTQIGGSDNAGLRKKIKDVESSIKQITSSTPEQLDGIRNRIQKIEQELDNPGAASTLVTILDTLDGFDKNKKGDVKKYIDDHDKAILGSTADAATTYSVYGVRKYVDTTAKNTLIGASTDATTANTIWGAKNYAFEIRTASYAKADIAAGNVLGKSGDLWPTQHTVYGVAKYADTTVKNSLLGAAGNKWPDKQTIWGVKDYADGVKTASYNKATIEAGNVLGKSGDLWPTQHTVYGVAKYAENLASSSYTAVGDLEDRLIGASTDAATADTIWGAKNYANTTVKNSLLGAAGNKWPDKQTIWGVKDYADGVKTASYNKATIEAGNVLGKDGDLWPTQHTVYGVAKYADTTVKNSLIGASTDATTANTIWGAKNYAFEIRTASYAKADIAAGNVLGKDGDLWPTQHTVYGVAKYATTVKNSLLGAAGDAWPTKQTIYSVKDYADGVQTASYAKANTAAGNVLGKSGDLWPTNHTVYGLAKYADEKIKTLSNTAFKVSRIEEGNEGILVFSTVS